VTTADVKLTDPEADLVVDMAENWQQRAQAAVERKNKLLSFGPNAFGLIVSTKHGFFAVDVEDNFVATALLHEGSYADHEFDMFQSLISETSDVLVVGPHIGSHAVPLSKRCRSLTAIEANPNTFTYLKLNMLLNDCNNMKVYNSAASDKKEKIKFLLSRENSGGSKRAPLEPHLRYVYDEPETIEIDAVSLDQLLGAATFDLIVMDIEGSEYFALKGMQNILERSKTLAVEFLPNHLKDVADVGPRDFIDTILPHFSWMYLEKARSLVSKEKIAERIVGMYDRGERHDLIYFLKDVSSEWLQEKVTDDFGG
jgi:FkbM family methyltransferase